MTQEALDLLPYEFARANRVLRDDGELLLGPDAPDWAIAEVSRITSGDLSVRNIADEDFDALLSKLYSGTQNSSESVMANIQDFVDLESAAAELEEAGDLLDAENDAPIVRLLNAILAESLKESASDIHIEPYEKEALVRFRLDGVLRTVLTPSIQIAPLLISRIKVMSKAGYRRATSASGWSHGCAPRWPQYRPACFYHAFKSRRARSNATVG